MITEVTRKHCRMRVQQTKSIIKGKCPCGSQFEMPPTRSSSDMDMWSALLGRARWQGSQLLIWTGMGGIGEHGERARCDVKEYTGWTPINPRFLTSASSDPTNIFEGFEAFAITR